MKKIICLVLCLLMALSLGGCQSGGSANEKTDVSLDMNPPIPEIAWGMTQTEVVAALEGMEWDYTGDDSMLVSYEKPIFGIDDYSYRGTTGSVELIFTRKAVVDGETVEPALCGICFVTDTTAVSLDDLSTEVEKQYGKASTSGETAVGWQLPWNETVSPRIKTVAALLHSGVTSDFANYCAQYGVQGVFPYDEALCKETWKSWEDAAAKLNSTYGPVIKLNESDGQITVVCEAQLAAFIPQLEKFL